MSLDTLAPLCVPVPPMLEQARGYFGSARLVAFYWEPVGDKALFDDGVVSADAERATYLSMLEHPTVAAQGRACDLGNSEQEAQQWLLLDRDARVLYALPARRAYLHRARPGEILILRNSRCFTPCCPHSVDTLKELKNRDGSNPPQ